MGYFETARKTKKIELDKEFWVEIYTDMKWGESKHFLQVGADGNIDMVTSADKFLTHIIKEWNLTDEAGNIAPIEQQYIDLLKRDDALKLVREAGGDVEAAETAKKN